jgi:hypothetical protein
MKTGIRFLKWLPAFAGMTNDVILLMDSLVRCRVKSQESRGNGLKSRMRSLALFIVSCLLLAVAGCGYSIHTKATMPFQSIRIVRIENKTVEPKLQDKLYLALTEEFLKEGVAVSPDASYKLTGTINSFELKILAEESDVATEYEVIIKASFELTDPSGKKKEFKDIGAPFIVSFAGAGPLNELIASKEVASEKAIRDMATEIVGVLIYR